MEHVYTWEAEMGTMGLEPPGYGFVMDHTGRFLVHTKYTGPPAVFDTAEGQYFFFFVPTNVLRTLVQL